jgi:hypothetical protein
MSHTHNAVNVGPNELPRRYYDPSVFMPDARRAEMAAPLGFFVIDVTKTMATKRTRDRTRLAQYAHTCWVDPCRASRAF